MSAEELRIAFPKDEKIVDDKIKLDITTSLSLAFMELRDIELNRSYITRTCCLVGRRTRDLQPTILKLLRQRS